MKDVQFFLDYLKSRGWKYSESIKTAIILTKGQTLGKLEATVDGWRFSVRSLDILSFHTVITHDSSGGVIQAVAYAS